MRSGFRFLSFLFISLVISLPVAASETGANSTLVWAGCGVTRKAFMSELAKAYEKKTGVHIDIQGGGATRGIRDAAKGVVQIGGACRPTLENDAAERGAKQIPVGWDALVAIVHKGNPVQDISFKQLRDIYLGKITNWKQLGGRDAPIQLYVRRGNLSGVGRTLRALVFANYDQVFTDKAIVVKSTGPLEQAVEQNIDAIGVTGVASAQRRNVKVLSLDGMEPTYDNIREGKYTLYRPLYLVVKRDGHDQGVDNFIRFALSPEGKAVIRNAGTVPYSDAMSLVMQQLKQYQRAVEAGL